MARIHLTAATNAVIFASILVSSVATAQTGASVGRPARPVLGQVVSVPGYSGPIYVVPVQPRDERTPRQRCWDNEAARIGGTLSDLDRRTIDLKCSQR